MLKSDSLGIADIVGQYVQLAPEGPSHFVGKCPFCGAGIDSLVLSVDTQYWHCLSCGANGDRYDFVARSEHVGRAEAILMVGHHTISGDPFPHARFKTAPPARAPEAKPVKPAPPPAAKPPEPPKAPAAPAAPGAAPGMPAPFLEFRNIIPSYQGAVLLDEKSRVLVGDAEFPSSAELAGVGEILSPILERAGNVYGQSNSTLPATLTLASEELAILVHKFGPAIKPRLLVVRLANPSDVPVARRLAASVSAKLS